MPRSKSLAGRLVIPWRGWWSPIASIEEVLKKEFGRSLADQGVHILDPFTGTGSFITRIMQEIPACKLQKKYETELDCN